MRYSKMFIPTLKEVPAEAEVISHKLMLRAGMIRKLASGLYTYLPLGLRAIRKVEQIVREEMNAAGAQELLMPIVQPAELWQESGRWEHYGRELLRFHDRHERACCLGPTHEEVITDIVRKEVRSYRDLPLNLYQIQTKFRDEIRPRFGLMRGREFIMKDAYSFDVDEEALDRQYEAMYRAYCNIFERCGLEYRPVEADTGSIGGKASHEFMVIADTGEDVIACCTQCEYAANVELAPVKAKEGGSDSASVSCERPVERVSTPGVHSVEDVAEFLGVKPYQVVKTLVLEADGEPVVAFIRGDRELNEVKLQRLLGAERLVMASDDVVRRVTGAPAGFAGPIGLAADVRKVADNSVAGCSCFVAGANEADAHVINVEWGRDAELPELSDIAVIRADDPCPSCGGVIELKRGIEVGHIFKLGTKYSEALGAKFLDSNGKEQTIVMGCYGIGIGRTVAAAIEQNHDDKGIIFPRPIAPFDVIISLLDERDKELCQVADDLYSALNSQGIDVLLDDRKERPGVKFKDSELIGIPVRVTIGKKFKKTGEIEITPRATGETVNVSKEQAVSSVRELLGQEAGRAD